MDQLLPTPGLANLRVEMEAIAQLVYLNHAAMAPMPRRVHESMARYLAGRRQFGDFDFDEEFERVSNGLGEGLAQLISATPEEIGFVENTSHGLNIAAQSLREEYIRVSPHGYNTEAEIAQVGEVLGDA